MFNSRRRAAIQFRSQRLRQTNSASATLTVNPPPPCTNPPPGLLSWWRAEGNALDQQGGNNGALINGAGFASGESGSAFNLDGANQYVLVTTPI